jgi:uncharacterized protein YbbC (DUF1343 family)
MYFSDTGLPWVPSSPHIPHAESPLYYPATGIIGELYTVSIGVGYTTPFQTFAAEWINADSLAWNLNSLNLEGVRFRPVHYKPYYSNLQGKMLHGVQIHFTDKTKAPLCLLQFYILQELYKLRPDKNIFRMSDPARFDMFDKVCGTDRVRVLFQDKMTVESIKDLWNSDIASYRTRASKYFLY